MQRFRRYRWKTRFDRFLHHTFQSRVSRFVRGGLHVPTPHLVTRSDGVVQVFVSSMSQQRRSHESSISHQFSSDFDVFLQRQLGIGHFVMIARLFRTRQFRYLSSDVTIDVTEGVGDVHGHVLQTVLRIRKHTPHHKSMSEFLEKAGSLGGEPDESDDEGGENESSMCESKPKKLYADSHAVFVERYAREFFIQHPSMVGTEYRDLKKRFAKDPIMTNTREEFGQENRKHKERVREWAMNNPEDAQRDEELRARDSAARRERKRKFKESSGGGAAGATVTHQKYSAGDSHAVKMEFLRECTDTALQLLRAAEDVRQGLHHFVEYQRAYEADRDETFS